MPKLDVDWDFKCNTETLIRKGKLKASQNFIFSWIFIFALVKGTANTWYEWKQIRENDKIFPNSNPLFLSREVGIKA